MRIEDIFAIAILPALGLLWIIYVLISARIKKKKRIKKEIKMDPVIQKLEKELQRIKAD